MFFKKLFLTAFFVFLSAYTKGEEKKLTQPILMEADNFTTNEFGEIIATGNVEIDTPEEKIKAEKIKYNKVKQEIELEKDIKINKDNILILAEKGKLDIETNNFKMEKSSMIFDKKTFINSKKLEKTSPTVYNGTNSSYFVCPVENVDINLSYEELKKRIEKDNDNIFSVESKTIEVDNEKKEIKMRNVLFKAKNIPFFYLPYLKTSSPFIKKTTSFKIPTFKVLSDYGIGVALKLNTNYKNKFFYNIEATPYTSGSVMLSNSFEYKESEEFLFELDIYTMFDNNIGADIKNKFKVTARDEGEFNMFRYAIKLESSGKINDNSEFYVKYDYFGDRYIQRDYFRGYENFSENNIYYFNVFDDKNNFFKADVLNYQKLREIEDVDLYRMPFFIPSFRLNYMDSFFKNTLSYNIDFNNILLSDTYSLEYFKTNLDFKFNYNYNFFGLDMDIDFNLYNNIYVYEPQLNKKMNNLNTMPEVGLTFKYPILFGGAFILEPIMQYFYSEEFGYKNFKFNEDSLESELTIGNIFTANRYSGDDYKENGHRVNYGLKANLSSKFGIFDFLIAQAYKSTLDFENQILGFYDNFSNIFLYGSYKIDFLNFNYIANVDRNFKNLDNNTFSFGISFRYISASLSYTYYAYNPLRNGYENVRHQVGYNMSIRVAKYWYLYHNFSYDIRVDKMNNLKLGIGYENNCFLSRVFVNMNNYNYHRELDYSFGFEFNFKNGIF